MHGLFFHVYTQVEHLTLWAYVEEIEVPTPLRQKRTCVHASMVLRCQGMTLALAGKIICSYASRLAGEWHECQTQMPVFCVRTFDPSPQPKLAQQQFSNFRNASTRLVEGIAPAPCLRRQKGGGSRSPSALAREPMRLRTGRASRSAGDGRATPARAVRGIRGRGEWRRQRRCLGPRC